MQVVSALLEKIFTEAPEVFANNVMPANAVAWYMDKRKFYINEPFDQQLLPSLLKKFPEKSGPLHHRARRGLPRFRLQ